MCRILNDRFEEVNGRIRGPLPKVLNAERQGPLTRASTTRGPQTAGRRATGGPRGRPGRVEGGVVRPLVELWPSLKLLDRCRRLSEPITLITRLRLDAALYEPAPPRRPVR